jgi:hypothetical protein
VETWNEQPILTEILDSYLGYYETNDSFSEQEELTLVQKEFRKIEISKARYLNHSITALLMYLEEAKEYEFAVSISLSGNTQQLYYPKEKPSSNIFMVQEPPFEYLAAAKSIISKKDKYIEYKPESLPFNIQIRKNDEGFILTITPICDIELLDRNNKIIKGRSNSKKTVFSSLKNGLYTLKSTKIQEPIKIRLK